MNAFFKGFGFSNYKSYGGNPVFFPDTKKINIIIGENNAGKSNVASYICKSYKANIYFIKSRGQIKGEYRKTLYSSKSDFFSGSDREVASFYFPITKQEIRSFFAAYTTANNERIVKSLIEGLDRCINEQKKSTLCKSDDFWIKVDFRPDSGALSIDAGYSFSGLDKRMLIDFLRSSNSQSCFIDLVNRMIGSETIYLPSVDVPLFYIPAFRKITKQSTNSGELSQFFHDGTNLIDEFFKLQNPSNNELYDKSKESFEKIKNFVRDVMGKNDIDIEIPNDKVSILVLSEGKRFSLDQLGAGIQEVIIIAALCTVKSDSVICIDEPELHMHPTLQKKLMQYLEIRTSNQYFITTHSAHLLDSVEDSSIYHVKMVEGVSQIEHISMNSEKSNICKDLGFRASDIVQSNCVIWVEGPSDRIYLKHWLKYFCQELKENEHFNIMFFGGRLFTHLSGANFDEKEYSDDLISLMALNQNSFLFMDSDKTSNHEGLKGFKCALVDSFSNVDAVWLTSGREVENYLNVDLIQKAVKDVHSGSDVKFSEDDILLDVSCKSERYKFVNMLRYKNMKSECPKYMQASKVEVAKKYIELEIMPSFDIHDLRDRLSELKTFIMSANGLLIENKGPITSANEDQLVFSREHLSSLNDEQLLAEVRRVAGQASV